MIKNIIMQDLFQMYTIDIRHLTSWPCQLHRHVIRIVSLARVLRTHMFELVRWCTSESEFSFPRRVFDPTIYVTHNLLVNHLLHYQYRFMRTADTSRKRQNIRGSSITTNDADDGHHSVGDLSHFLRFSYRKNLFENYTRHRTLLVVNCNTISWLWIQEGMYP